MKSLTDTSALFRPFTFPISGIEIKNRILMAPMSTYAANDDGSLSTEELSYYKRRSKGVAVVVTAAAYVMPEGKGFSGQIGIHDDSMIPSLALLAKTIQAEGAKAIVQIYHGGRLSVHSEVPNGIVYSASTVAANIKNAIVPKAMSDIEISETIHAFGEACRRAIVAGFDGLEIDGANSYLLQQFFSPESNLRTDSWGGDTENRTALPLAIVAEVKSIAARYCTKPFIIGYRISPEEVSQNGINLEDTIFLIKEIAEKKIDYIHLSTNNFWIRSIKNLKILKAQSILIHEKTGHLIPFIGVGCIQTPKDAMNVLDTGFPLLALGRILLKEPEWIEKVKNDNENLRLTLDTKDFTDLDIPAKMWAKLKTHKGWIG